jgi:uncharacterized membrane protein
MFNRMRESHVRSVVKAISWRVVGSIDTFVISLLITGSYVAAGSVASLESVSKVVLYYLHERAWSAFRIGRTDVPAPTESLSCVSIIPAQDTGLATGAQADLFDTPAGAPSIVPFQHTPPLSANEDN